MALHLLCLSIDIEYFSLDKLFLARFCPPHGRPQHSEESRGINAGVFRGRFRHRVARDGLCRGIFLHRVQHSKFFARMSRTRTTKKLTDDETTPPRCFRDGR